MGRKGELWSGVAVINTISNKPSMRCQEHVYVEVSLKYLIHRLLKTLSGQELSLCLFLFPNAWHRGLIDCFIYIYYIQTQYSSGESSELKHKDMELICIGVVTSIMSLDKTSL